jgi:hypothetical protein
MQIRTIAVAALLVACLAGIACVSAENATIVEYRGHGVLMLPMEHGGFIVTEKYVVDSSDAEVIIEFQNGTTYNITAGMVLRSKAWEGDEVEVSPRKYNESSTRRHNPHVMACRLIKSNHDDELPLLDGFNVLDFPRVAKRTVQSINSTMA